MTSPEWEAANEDDSDRFPQVPHASASESTESNELGSRVVPDPARVARYAEAIASCVIADPEQMRDLTEAVVAVADTEQAELRAEVGRLGSNCLDWMRRYGSMTESGRELLARAEAAEAKLAKVEAAHACSVERMSTTQAVWNLAYLQDDLRAVLADAPAEQRTEGGA